MITKRPAEQRGHANYGWLDTWHTFSFADYHDPEQMGWGPLRVINDDTVAPGRGFGTHGHRDMEIISVVLSGALAHQDSMGHGTTIVPGEVQRMSAGKGVMHSEFNPSADTPARFLQIWIQPTERGGTPSYEQKRFDEDSSHDDWQLLASPDGRADSVSIRQDATLARSRIAGGQSRTVRLAAGRLAYLHVIAGQVSLSGVQGSRTTGSASTLGPGDGARVADESTLILTASDNTDVLLFDLPA